MLNPEQIKTASLDDIVFEQRNKAYGAYDLRKRYGSSVLRSFLFALLAFVFAVFSPKLIAMFAAATAEEVKKPKLVNYDMLAPPPDMEETPPPPNVPPPPQVDVIKFLPPVVEEDTKVPDEEFASQEDLKKADAGAVTVDVTGDIDPNQFKEAEIIAPDEPSEPEIFTIVEQNPEFPGGEGAMYEYLGKNIKYPQLARDNGVQGVVTINFVVNEDGSVSNVRALRGIGGGCDEEAVRVVRTLPKFIPGRQNGRNVKVYYNMPVNFTLRQ